MKDPDGFRDDHLAGLMQSARQIGPFAGHAACSDMFARHWRTCGDRWLRMAKSHWPSINLFEFIHN
jgi:hypothetical protein